jgi:uncharacterized protein involved in outer membrane biogenesis
MSDSATGSAIQKNRLKITRIKGKIAIGRIKGKIAIVQIKDKIAIVQIKDKIAIVQIKGLNPPIRGLKSDPTIVTEQMEIQMTPITVIKNNISPQAIS